MDPVLDFVLDDFREMGFYEKQQPVSVSDLAPYWDVFLQDCALIGRPVPDGLTPETYAASWNNFCSERKEN